MKNRLCITSLMTLMVFIMACGESGNSSQPDSDGEAKYNNVDLNSLNIDGLLKEIKKREKILSEEGDGISNHRGIKLMRAYAVFAERFKNREAAPEYLYKAGEMAMAFELPVDAIKYFDRLYNEYPDFEKRPYALFLKAFVTENQSKNFDEAERLYNLFLEQYPNHEMADDAQYSIENLGKSPAELIREFEKKDSINKAQEKLG